MGGFDRPWSEAEEKQLTELFYQGLGCAKIGEIMGRGKSSISHKARKLGLKRLTYGGKVYPISREVLIDLFRQDHHIPEIAAKLGIKVESVYQMKDRLIRFGFLTNPGRAIRKNELEAMKVRPNINHIPAELNGQPPDIICEHGLLEDLCAPCERARRSQMVFEYDHKEGGRKSPDPVDEICRLVSLRLNSCAESTAAS